MMELSVREMLSCSISNDLVHQTNATDNEYIVRMIKENVIYITEKPDQYKYSIINHAFEYYSKQKKIIYSVKCCSDIQLILPKLENICYELHLSLVTYYPISDIMISLSNFDARYTNAHVIVCTIHSLLDMICHRYVLMPDISCIILDDLIDANKNHPYCMLMKEYWIPHQSSFYTHNYMSIKSTSPRIIGFVDSEYFSPLISLLSLSLNHQKTDHQLSIELIEQKKEFDKRKDFETIFQSKLVHIRPSNMSNELFHKWSLLLDMLSNGYSNDIKHENIVQDNLLPYSIYSAPNILLRFCHYLPRPRCKNNHEHSILLMYPNNHNVDLIILVGGLIHMTSNGKGIRTQPLYQTGIIRKFKSNDQFLCKVLLPNLLPVPFKYLSDIPIIGLPCTTKLSAKLSAAAKAVSFLLDHGLLDENHLFPSETLLLHCKKETKSNDMEFNPSNNMMSRSKALNIARSKQKHLVYRIYYPISFDSSINIRYPIRIPTSMRFDSWTCPLERLGPFYLYSIYTNSKYDGELARYTHTVENDIRQLVDHELSFTFAIMTALPIVTSEYSPSFRVYLQDNVTTMVSLHSTFVNENEKEFYFTKDQLSQIISFQPYFFKLLIQKNHILYPNTLDSDNRNQIGKSILDYVAEMMNRVKINGKYIEEPQFEVDSSHKEIYMIVPLTSSPSSWHDCEYIYNVYINNISRQIGMKIDWNLIHLTISNEYKTLLDHINALKQYFNSKNPDGDLDSFMRFALQRCIVWSQRSDTLYRIVEYCPELNPVICTIPESEFPISPKDQIKSKYGIDIFDDTQPLVKTRQIEVPNISSIPGSNSILLQSKLDSSEEKITGHGILIPESVVLLPWTTFMLQNALLIPTIMYHVRFYSNVNDLINNPIFSTLSSSPNINYIHQALTGSNIPGNSINYERLELLGDSFLKYSVTVDLFLSNIDTDENLELKRSKIVSNMNLFDIGYHQLKLHLFSNLTGFHTMKLFTPPHICSIIETHCNSSDIQFPIRSLFDECYFWYELQVFCNSKEENNVNNKQDSSLFEQEHYQLGVKYSSKTISDMVEALIGAYVLGCGNDVGRQLLYNLGIISVFGSDTVLYSKESIEKICNNCVLIQSNDMKDLELSLGYRFKNKKLLEHTCIHISCSNDRLKFLGNAILDWVITRYYYTKYPNLGPSELTEIRSACVSNESYSRLCIIYELYGLLRLSNDNNTWTRVCQYINSLNSQQLFKNEKPIDNNRTENEIIMNAPKILSDLFESIAGAVYLDCELNLDIFYSVYEPIIICFLDRNIKPNDLSRLNPIKEVLEMLQGIGVHKNEITMKIESLDNSRIKGFKCDILVRNKIIGTAKASTQALAKRFAAKEAHYTLLRREKKDLLIFP